MLGIEGNLSTTYHLQTDGQTERINREVEKYLRMFVNHRQDDWADWLPLVEFAYNNVKNEAMGSSPFYLNKGQNPRALPSDPVSDPSIPAGKYLNKLQKIMKKAEESLQRAKESMKKKWDRSKRNEDQFEAGDLVLVQAEYLPSMRPSTKLDDKWRGPFRVMAKKGEATYELDLLPTWKGHRTLNASRLKKFIALAFPGQHAPGMRPDPVLKGERREEYEVEEILDQREENK
jgi:hypothetical protein